MGFNGAKHAGAKPRVRPSPTRYILYYLQHDLHLPNTHVQQRPEVKYMSHAEKDGSKRAAG